MLREEHALTIAADLGITVNWIERDVVKEVIYGCASPVGREIWIPPIIDEMSYLAAIHEIGHCMDPAQADWRVFLTMNEIDCELAAWRWTFDHAMKITGEGIAFAERAFLTYTRWEEKRQYTLATEIGEIKMSALNWIVRVYDLDDEEKLVASWTITNRSENEAYSEAEADILRDHPGADWSLTEIGEI